MCNLHLLIVGYEASDVSNCVREILDIQWR